MSKVWEARHDDGLYCTELRGYIVTGDGPAQLIAYVPMPDETIPPSRALRVARHAASGRKFGGRNSYAINLEDRMADEALRANYLRDLRQLALAPVGSGYEAYELGQLVMLADVLPDPDKG